MFSNFTQLGPLKILTIIKVLVFSSLNPWGVKSLKKLSWESMRKEEKKDVQVDDLVKLNSTWDETRNVFHKVVLGPSEWTKHDLKWSIFEKQR